MHKLEDKVFFMIKNQIQQGIIFEINQSRSGYSYWVNFYNEEPEECKTYLDETKVFSNLYKLLENLEDEFYLRIGELSKDE
jgi:hypothetical protein